LLRKVLGNAPGRIDGTRTGTIAEFSEMLDRWEVAILVIGKLYQNDEKGKRTLAGIELALPLPLAAAGIIPMFTTCSWVQFRRRPQKGRFVFGTIEGGIGIHDSFPF
jgi:hypothetical protein